MIMDWTNTGGGASFPGQPLAITSFAATGLDCCETNQVLLNQIITLLQQQGFRRERPTRADLLAKEQLILNEIRDMKKEIRRRDIPGGYNDATAS